MAATEGKRSLRRAQRTHSRRAQSSNQTSWVSRPPRVIRFPQASGKLVKSIEFFSDEDSNNLSIFFRDQSSLNITVNPSFMLEAAYAKWMDGNERVVRRWPHIRPLEFRSIK